MLDAERCRIERNPSRLGTDWSDHTSGSCGPEDRAGNQDLAFAHNTKDVYFSRSCRMTDLGDRGPTRATRGDIDRWTRVKARLRAELGEKVFSSWFGRMELAASTIRQCTSPYQPSFSRGGSKRVTRTGCLPAGRPSLSLSLVLNLRRAPPSSGTCLPARGPRAPPNAHKTYAPAPWRI